MFRSHNDKLTNLVLDVVGHTGHLVEKSQRLVHALLNDTQVGQYLLHTQVHIKLHQLLHEKKKKSIMFVVVCPLLPEV